MSTSIQTGYERFTLILRLLWIKIQLQLWIQHSTRYNIYLEFQIIQALAPNKKGII